MLFPYLSISIHVTGISDFAHPSSILNDVYTSEKEIVDEWYVKQKWTRRVQKESLAYKFFLLINI